MLVGINPTRRGAELARDITYTDCQFIVTETSHLSLLDGLDLGDANGHILVVDDADGPASQAAALAPYVDAPLPDVEIDETGTYQLLFTSGTSGAPKACILSQGRLFRSSSIMTANMGLNADDTLYMMMPLFHSNAIITAFCPWLITGGVAAVRRKFSASGFLPDVRKYGVTYFNYVGKPLSYILATPEEPDDADNPIRIGSATKPPTSTSNVSGRASGASSSTATAPPRAVRTSPAAPRCRRARSGCPPMDL